MKVFQVLVIVIRYCDSGDSLQLGGQSSKLDALGNEA
jgi:hypothetical protein